MDVPEEVEIHLENNPAWSESVKNEKRRILEKTGQALVSETASPKRKTQGDDKIRQYARVQALSVDKIRQDPERQTLGCDTTRQDTKRQALSVDKTRQDPKGRTLGVDKTRQVDGCTANGTRGKCQLGAETKGTPGKTHESLYSSSPKGNYRKTLGEGCSSRAPKRKATADLMSTNHGEVGKTESKPSPSGRSHPKVRRGSDYQDKRISELFSLVNTLTEDLKMTREELDKERKERKRERQDQSLREEMLNERIEKLEQERKRRR